MLRHLLTALVLSLSGVRACGAAGAERFDLTLQRGHTTAIQDLEFTPSGRWLVSGGSDFTVKVWDMETTRLLRTYESLSFVANAVAVDETERHLVACGGLHDGQVKVFDFASGSVLEDYVPVKGWLTIDLSFAPDGEHFISGGSDGRTMVFRRESSTPLREFGPREDFVNALALRPGGDVVAVANGVKGAALWDWRTGALVKELPPTTGESSAVAWSSDGALLAVGNGEPAVNVFRADGTHLHTFALGGRNTHVTGLAFGASDRRLYASVLDYRVFSLDPQTGEVAKEKRVDQWLEAVAYNRQREVLAVGGEDGNIWLFDNDLEQVHLFGAGYGGDGMAGALSESGRYFATGTYDGDMIVWDLAEGRLKFTYRCDPPELGEGEFMPCINEVFAWGEDGFVVHGQPFGTRLWRPGHELASFDLSPKDQHYGAWSIGPDRKLAAWITQDKARVWELATAKVLSEVDLGGTWTATSICIDDHRGVLYTDGPHDEIKIWSVFRGAQTESLDLVGNGCAAMVLSPDAGRLAAGSSVFSVWDTASGERVRSGLDHGCKASTLAFSEDGTYLYTGGNSDHAIKRWEISSGRLTQTYKGHVTSILSITPYADGRLLASTGSDGAMRIWDVESGDVLTGYYDDGEWVLVDGEGYFAGSRGGGQLMTITSDMRPLSIDQFALAKNRPDKVMTFLRSPDRERIEHYAARYERRMRKAGLDPRRPEERAHVPSARVASAQASQRRLDLRLEFSDEHADLKSYNIWVNDVPVHGSDGKPLHGRSQTVQTSVELSTGANKIEVSAFNVRGAESFRAVTQAQGPEAKRPTLYVLALGVSSYRDASLDLAFAHKDARDLRDVLAAMRSTDAFSRVVARVYTNQEVTRDTIQGAKRLLAFAGVNDVFVLFIAGHGVYEWDRRATYYYLTHEADLDDLARTAAPFEMIEDLLQDIAPRRKLFLIDTCESGEADEGTARASVAMLGARGIKARAARGIALAQTKQKATPRSYLHDFNRYIYNDLSRRSGAVVFSSCLGGEYSYESDERENGLFTEAIIEALKGKAADGEGRVSVDALRAYVSKVVPEWSEGAQHPTVDRDNIYQRFGFPVVGR